MNLENNNPQLTTICVKCGTELPPQSKFCGKCGSLITNNNSSQINLNKVQPFTPTTPQKTKPLKKEKPPKKPIDKKLLIPIISACSAIILIIFLFGTHIICINHDWSAATCVEPAQCWKCDKYKDNELGNHDFHYYEDIDDMKCIHCNILKSEYDEQK